MKHRQLEHEEVIVQNQMNQKSREIVLFLDGLRTPSNIAGIFRLAECFGVQKILIHGEADLLISKSFRSIARIHEKHLDIQQIESVNILSEIKTYQSSSFKIVALEYTTESVTIDSLKIEDDIVLILGNERHGVDKAILEQCDYSTHIPMYGRITSLNVQQACSIALYAFRR